MNYKTFFNIREVKDNFVIMEDKSIHAVLSISSLRNINTTKYQKFLEDINYPIKIIIRSVNNNLKERIEDMDLNITYAIKQKKNKSLLRKYKRFIEWFKRYAKRKCKPTKKYYLVLAYKTDSYRFDIAVNKLKERIEEIKKVFKATQLNNYDLINLYSSYVNNAIYTQKYLTPMLWLDEYKKTLKKKIGKEVKITSRSFLSEYEFSHYITELSDIKINPNHIKIGNLFIKGLSATGFPNYVNKHFLRPAFIEKSDIDVIISINQSPITELEDYLKKELEDVEEILYKSSKKGINNKKLKTKEKILKKCLKGLQNQNYTPLKLSLFFLAKGKSIDDVNFISNKIVNLMKSNNIILKPTTNYQKELIKSAIPLGADFLKKREIIIPNTLLSHNLALIK